MATDQIKEQEENEIDLIEIIQKLWHRRKFILKITVVFACVGFLVAIFSAKEYTASCTIVPQVGEKGGGGSLGGLAAIAGINLGNINGGEMLSPKIYPKVLASVPFQKELMMKELKFAEYEKPVKLIDYYTHEDYQKFSLIGTVSQYTIGLPGLIMKAIRGEQPEVVLEENNDLVIQTLSQSENQCMRILQQQVVLKVNEKEGILTLSAHMPEPLAAAQLASIVQEMLQRYITEFKIEKAQAKLKFIEERYEEAKKHFEVRQEELAAFRDANRNFASAIAKTTEERLSNEYAVALSVYSELAKQREQANIQVKEDTPIFTIVEPVTVPTERSKPKRPFILVAFTFLGACLGAGLVLGLPYVAQISGSRRLKDWLPEEKNG